MSGEPYSLYIHVPFCLRKCDYCHFFVVPFRQEGVFGFLEGLYEETLLRNLTHSPLTIYFGGGTPSLLTPDQIEKILSWIPHETTREITLEANPERITTDEMRRYRKAGINRVSLGVQSFDDALLSTLSRKHTSKQAREAVFRVAEAGISNISIDLMYEIPSQTLASWLETVRQATELPITHLSLYNLTFEPHTLFYKRQKSLLPLVADSETSLQMVEEGVALLEQAGLKRYEISAFAWPGYESLHNTGYWTGRPFIGLGPSAFSYWEGARAQNHCSLSRYSKDVVAGKLPVGFEEKLPPQARAKESLAIGLRLLAGVPFSPFAPETQATLQKLEEQGLVTSHSERVALTPRGRLFYDLVAEELID